ncbi:MAG: carboxylating nicotinate-nucleotide diphosphorylase [Candidatus Margulisbacteria bacterium]|jgi:nicotinate-nucleotide pyrophosphorylase (carboxylating)|nr:carboxylating nicotinate-nucleotide diphosphorylase [Candidatus Margulisiibacteriota bacterium]
MLSQNIRDLLKRALREDAPRGDITSCYFGNSKTRVTARIIAKADGILCGLEAAEQCFRLVSRRIIFQANYADGDRIKKGAALAELNGGLNAILLAERTALNLLQHLSGIATETGKMAARLKHSKARLLDTRKTTPGLRSLEKYAVRCGGGENHRADLSAMVLIKNNHLAGLSLRELSRRLKYFKRRKKNIRVEIEAATLKQVENFLRLPVDIIMLDNLRPPLIRRAVNLRAKLNPDCLLEISGNVRAANIGALAKTGADYISCGALTHSAPALDIALRVL